MADYQPDKAPGRDLTFTASAAISAGQLLYVTGSKAVAPTTGVTTAWIGHAVNDAAVGAQVTVSSGGVQVPTCSGTVNAGDVIVAAAAGAVVTNATPAVGQQVGIALTSGTNTTIRAKYVR